MAKIVVVTGIATLCLGITLGGAAVFLGFIGGMALLMALKAVSGEEDEEEGYKVVPEEAEAAQPPSPVPEDAPADLSSNVTMEPEGVASRPPGGLSRRYTSMDEQDMRRRALMGLEGESATGSPWVRPAQAHPHHPHYRPLGFVRQAFGMHYTLSHGDDLGEVARPHGYAAYSVSTPGSMLDIEGYGAQQNGREPEPPFPLPLKVNHSAAPSLTATPTYHVAVPAPPSEASLVQRPFPSSMAAAVYIDSGIDGLFIGVAWVTAPSAAFIMAVSLGVEMAFLGLTFSITVQRSSGVGVLKKLCALLWGPCLLYIFAVVGAMASSAVMHYPLVFSGVSAFGTSALLYMVAEELLLSAHENPEIGHIWWIDVCFFIGFLIPIYLDA
eukprot:jgi/Mesvir1/26039/Mv09583-RA.1